MIIIVFNCKMCSYKQICQSIHIIIKFLMELSLLITCFHFLYCHFVLVITRPVHKMAHIFSSITINFNNLTIIFTLLILLAIFVPFLICILVLKHITALKTINNVTAVAHDCINKILLHVNILTLWTLRHFTWMCLLNPYYILTGVHIFHHLYKLFLVKCRVIRVEDILCH